MSRPSRIEYPGAYYHVMNRGITSQGVFLSEDDYKGYLNLRYEGSPLTFDK